MGTTSSQQEVVEFYSQQLKQRGWQRDDTVVIRGTGETVALGWEKAPYIFRLGFDKPGDPRNSGHGEYPTVYSILLTTKT
jgi:hypothetical protein